MFIVFLHVTSGVGLGDSSTACGTLSLPQGQTVANSYIENGIIPTIAGLIAAPMWSLLSGLVLRAVVLPLGTPFWFCVALYGCGVVGAGVLRRWCVNVG